MSDKTLREELDALDDEAFYARVAEIRLTAEETSGPEVVIEPNDPRWKGVAGHPNEPAGFTQLPEPSGSQTVRAREQAGGLDHWAAVLEAHDPDSSAAGIVLLREAAKTLRGLASDAALADSADAPYTMDEECTDTRKICCSYCGDLYPFSEFDREALSCQKCRSADAPEGPFLADKLDAMQHLGERIRAGGDGPGTFDSSMLPYLIEINAIPGVYTLQSCAGHTTGEPKADKQGGPYNGHLWLRFARPDRIHWPDWLHAHWNRDREPFPVLWIELGKDSLLFEMRGIIHWLRDILNRLDAQGKTDD